MITLICDHETNVERIIAAINQAAALARGGCKVAVRLPPDVAASLPPDVGAWLAEHVSLENGEIVGVRAREDEGA